MYLLYMRFLSNSMCGCTAFVDKLLLPHQLYLYFRQDGLSLRLLRSGNSEVIEVRLHLLGDQELSWLTGSLNLLEVSDITNGKPTPENGDPLAVSMSTSFLMHL
jgi:hypothetical protein